MHLLQFRPLDILDILIVAYVIYRLLLLMKGTRAVQMLFGLLILLIIAFLASWWQLEGVNWIFGSLKAVWIVAFVILFQPEIRTALSQLGRHRFLGLFFRTENKAVGEVVKAATRLRTGGIGALMVFERNNGLKNFIDTGTEIGAQATEDLLITLFTPHSPLHDGAVIIRGETIVAAGCILPLSQDPLVERTLGMRHRAALGLVEETDALCVIVSEENKTISLAMEGKISKALEPAEIQQKLSATMRRR
ncbi:MAG: diadenylate cyclase CdaA [Candidatus Edwardsbacteria bacterium]